MRGLRAHADEMGSAERDERRELAERLESELDEFIEELGRNSTGYADGWPEDRWEEEMDKHPFFMKRAPDPGSGELPPLLEGLAKLKFDPDENSPVELAENYKGDGNFYFKNKNYRLSVVSYTEGLKAECGDPKVDAALYNNRAQAHYSLGNHRSALNDSVRALSLDSEYAKCKIRAAKSAFKLLDFEACVKFCDALPQNDRDPSLEKLKAECEKILNESSAKADVLQSVLEAMRKKGIKYYDPNDESSDVSVYLSSIPSIETPARLSECGDEIIWPIALLYPQYGVYDYYQEFPESLALRHLIDEVLAEPPDWDERKEYKPDLVDVFYIGRDVDELHPADLNKSLLDVLKEKQFFLRRMSPTFVVKLKKTDRLK